MGRIRNGYVSRFRSLLQAANARRVDDGIRWLLDKAQRLSASEGIPEEAALARIESDLAARGPFRKARPKAAWIFYCDSGLGGLARWLRAAGYEALWTEGIADDELLRKAREIPGAVLTTDSMIMERRVVRDGYIPALWLPPTLHVGEQLAIVFREFGLALAEPRCMSCGGELQRVEKEALRERIPPKTYRWLDEYFVCRRCGKLFWHGTHWQRISDELRRFGVERS